MATPSSLLGSGPENPFPTTPPRAPGSVRRTFSFDMTRSEGLLGPVVADVRGRDLATSRTGAEEVGDSFSIALHIDPARGIIDDMDVSVAAAAMPDLSGARANGLGRHLAELHPDEHRARFLAFSALEDLGGALLVSGYAPLHAGVIGMSLKEGEERAAMQGDMCAGWARGKPLLETLRVEGIAALPVGPPAPTLESDDPLSWHDMADMQHPTVRRRRRLDVVPAALGSGDLRPLTVHSHFRDSFAADDGEIVMHEYLLDASVDGDGIIERITVDPRVLPWRECPAAVDSAQRLVGTLLADTPARVRADLVGPSTCTHLNSTLRCLADAQALATGKLFTGTTTGGPHNG